MEGLAFIFVVFLCIIGFFMFLYFVPVALWVTAIFAGVPVSIGQLIGMRFRKTPPSIIINSLIIATKAGVPLTLTDLEAHYLAGGDVTNVIMALISANNANVSLTFKQAAAIDLAGINNGNRTI